jgi:hypothetical protein
MAIPNWRKLYTHYDKVCEHYHLTYTDVLRQLDIEPHYSYINFFYQKYNLTPSKIQGSIGRQFRDLLTMGLNKTVWLPSNVSEKDLLIEQQCALQTIIII